MTGTTTSFFFNFKITLFIIVLEMLGLAASCIKTFLQFNLRIFFKAIKADSCLVRPPVICNIFLKFNLYKYFLCFLL